MSDWIRKGEAELEQDRYMYLSGGFNDMERVVCVTNGRYTEVDAIQSDHEEADSGMFVHIHHAMETFSPERVVLWSIDTNVAIMVSISMYSSATLLRCSSTLESANVNNLFQCIQLQEILEGLCLLLYSYSCITGCDSMTAFVVFERSDS